jgi:cbb3-type cytochrome oxidase subunit 3
MEIYSFLSSAITVVTFVMFIAIVAWAWSRHRHDVYRDAANAPFALPDEIRTHEESRP